MSSEIKKYRSLKLTLNNCFISERVVKGVGKNKLANGKKKVTSGRIYVSPDWINKTVIVVLKDGK